MKRLLVVDDDADMRECLVDLLCVAYDVVAVSNGADAVFETAYQSFDAIVLDLSMPILDGIGVVEELKCRGIGVPVVLASASLEVAETARKLGVADYVSKPFPIELLEAKLERVTSGPG